MLIKVVTYNLHKGKNIFGRAYDMARLRNLLNHESCDIGFFQEVLGNHQFNKSLSSHNELLIDEKWQEHSFVKSSMIRNFEHGNSIISKYPIIEEKRLDLTLHRLEKRSALLALIDFGKFKIQCICTHLNLRKGDRIRQANMLLSFIKENEIKNVPIILAGDFNDREGQIVKYLIDEGGFSSQDNESMLLTFPSVLPMFSLDRVLAKNLDIIKSKVGQSKNYRSYSDHLPLFYQFRIPRS